MQNRTVLIVCGLRLSVSRLLMVLLCFSLEMVYCVSWYMIIFALSFLTALLLVFMLCCLSCTLELWLEYLEVTSC